jgi:hypothetical protein
MIKSRIKIIINSLISLKNKYEFLTN